MAVKNLSRSKQLGISYFIGGPAIEFGMGVVIFKGIAVGRFTGLVVAGTENLVVHDSAVPEAVFVLAAAPVLECLVQAHYLLQAPLRGNLVPQAFPGHGEHLGKSVSRPAGLPGAGNSTRLESLARGKRKISIVTFCELLLARICERRFGHRPVYQMPERAVGELFHGAGTHIGGRICIGSEKGENAGSIFGYGA